MRSDEILEKELDQIKLGKRPEDIDKLIKALEACIEQRDEWICQDEGVYWQDVMNQGNDDIIEILTVKSHDLTHRQ